MGNKVNLTMEGQLVEALIDTGATISVISQNMCTNILSKPQIPVDRFDISSCKLANGKEVSIYFKSYAMLSIEGIILSRQIKFLPVYDT